MSFIEKLKDLFRKKNTGVGAIEETKVEVPEDHILNLDNADEVPNDGLGIQTTFNTDDFDVLLEEGELENVSDNE